MKIFVQIKLDDEGNDILRSRLPDDAELVGLGEDREYENFSECGIAFGNVPLPWTLRSPNLRWLQLNSVGTDPYYGELPRYAERGIILTHLKDFFGVPVAETALAGIMALKRGLDKLVRRQELGQWVSPGIRYELNLLSRSKAIILGGGCIGRTIKKMLGGFDVDVLFYDKAPESGDLRTADQLDRELPDADLVIGCLPENERTRNLLNRDRLALLRRNAILVNVGRGSLLDETALVEMLENGALAGAVLDVSAREPIPREDPFWKCRNLILTQHSAGGTTDELPRMARFFLENFQRYHTGETLFGIVRGV